MGKRKKAVMAHNAKVSGMCAKACRSALKKTQETPAFKEFFEKHFFYTLMPEQHLMRKAFTDWLENRGLAMVLAMRGIGKTDIITIACVCYHLIYVDREATFLISSKAATTYVDVASKVTDILISELGRASFKYASTRRISLKENRRKQPSVRFSPLRSGVRGARADYVLLDDAVNEDDDRQVERENTQKYFNKMFNVQPSMFVIGQYAHESDLHTWLEKNDRVVVSRFWWGDVSDELKNVVGRGNLDELKAGNTDRQFGHNYLGIHINDSSKMYFKDIAVGEFEMGLNAIACIDPAFSDNATSDYTGLAVAFKQGNDYYAHVSEFKESIMNVWQDLMIRLSAMGVRRLFIETNNGGLVILGLMKTFARENNLGFWTIDGIHSSTSKQARILNAINPIKNNLMLDVEGDYQCVLNWYADTAEHDDGVDALAMAINKLVERRI